jgi:hypothetical protein
LALSSAGLLLIARLGPAGSGIAPVLVGLLVFPAGAALTFSGATVAAVQRVPAGEAGLAAGVVNTALEIGPTVGLAVLVSLAGAHAAAARAGGADAPAAAAAGYGFALGLAGAAAAAAALAAVAAARAGGHGGRAGTDRPGADRPDAAGRVGRAI